MKARRANPIPVVRITTAILMGELSVQSMIGAYPVRVPSLFALGACLVLRRLVTMGAL